MSLILVFKVNVKSSGFSLLPLNCHWTTRLQETRSARFTIPLDLPLRTEVAPCMDQSTGSLIRYSVAFCICSCSDTHRIRHRRTRSIPKSESRREIIRLCQRVYRNIKLCPFLLRRVRIAQCPPVRELNQLASLPREANFNKVDVASAYHTQLNNAFPPQGPLGGRRHVSKFGDPAPRQWRKASSLAPLTPALLCSVPDTA